MGFLEYRVTLSLSYSKFRQGHRDSFEVWKRQGNRGVHYVYPDVVGACGS